MIVTAFSIKSITDQILYCMTDEAWFHLSGQINSQKLYWYSVIFHIILRGSHSSWTQLLIESFGELEFYAELTSKYTANTFSFNKMELSCKMLFLSTTYYISRAFTSTQERIVSTNLLSACLSGFHLWGIFKVQFMKQIPTLWTKRRTLKVLFKPLIVPFCVGNLSIWLLEHINSLFRATKSFV